MNIALEGFCLFLQCGRLVPDKDGGPSFAVSGFLDEVLAGRVAVHGDDNGGSALEDFIVKTLVNTGALALRGDADKDVFLQDPVSLGAGDE